MYNKKIFTSLSIGFILFIGLLSIIGNTFAEDNDFDFDFDFDFENITPADQFTHTIGDDGFLSEIHPQFDVSEGHTNTQMNTIDINNGIVYVAFMRAGPNGDRRGKFHETVVKKGEKTGETWEWTETAIDTRTAFDVWHNAPSIVVDTLGYIHVAYNMHNIPWQYQVSTNPEDITGFEFRGQEVSDAEFNRYYFENKTSFPTQGSASIPGKQISYPAFYKDSVGDIYVTYRFAAQPGEAFSNRMYSSGVSKYDIETQEWTSIPDEIPGVFAGEQGWTSYLPQLGFDADNTLHFVGVWKAGTAGALTGKPCYTQSADGINFSTAQGSNITFPIKPDDCPNITGIPDDQELNSITSFAVSKDWVKWLSLSLTFRVIEGPIEPTPTPTPSTGGSICKTESHTANMVEGIPKPLYVSRDHKKTQTSTLKITQDNTIIEGCNISSTNGNCIEIAANVKNVTIRNSVIGPCDGKGIFIDQGANDILIQQNYIHEFETGIESYKNYGIRIIGNELKNPKRPFPRGQHILFTYLESNGKASEIMNNRGYAALDDLEELLAGETTNPSSSGAGIDPDDIGAIDDLLDGESTTTTPSNPESLVSSLEILSHKTYGVSTNRVLINFVTNEKTKAYVLYGEGSDLSSSTVEENSFNYSDHNQVIQNLKEGTKYNYKIYVTNTEGKISTDEGSFTTQETTISNTSSSSGSGENTTDLGNLGDLLDG